MRTEVFCILSSVMIYDGCFRMTNLGFILILVRAMLGKKLCTNFYSSQYLRPSKTNRQNQTKPNFTSPVGSRNGAIVTLRWICWEVDDTHLSVHPEFIHVYINVSCMTEHWKRAKIYHFTITLCVALPFPI